MPATVKIQTTAVTQATTVTPETSNIKDDSNTLSLPLTTAGTQGNRINTGTRRRLNRETDGHRSPQSEANLYHLPL